MTEWATGTVTSTLQERQVLTFCFLEDNSSHANAECKMPSAGLHLILRQVVLLAQDLVKRPEAHLLDVAQLTMAVEVFLGILSSTAKAPRHSPQQLNEQCQMILIPAQMQCMLKDASWETLHE